MVCSTNLLPSGCVRPRRIGTPINFTCYHLTCVARAGLEEILMLHKAKIATAVAALLAGTVWVAAQGTQKEAPSGTPGAQPTQKGEPKGQRNGVSKEADPKAAPKAAEPKADPKAAPKAAEPKADPKAAPKAAEPKADPKAAPKAAEPKADPKAAPKAAEPKADPKAAPKAAEPKADPKAAPKAAEPKADPKSQPGAGAQEAQQGTTTTVTTEQRTQIRQTIIKESNAPRVTNVNFSLNVGTVVPRRVKVAVLPTTVVEIYPAWRGYRYFIVGDRIVIVEPDTLRIVFIIDA
jgi:type IV secretory pathway VirB10-like protein